MLTNQFVWVLCSSHVQIILEFDYNHILYVMKLGYEK